MGWNMKGNEKEDGDENKDNELNIADQDLKKYMKRMDEKL